MAESKCINPAELELLGLHISEIASTCDALRGLSIAVFEDRNSELCISLQVLSEKAGYLADECARILGTTQHIGDWKSWSLSPAARDAEKALSEARNAGEASHG